ncbi:MAG: aldehyde dehydrogenase family protein, partial [Salibacteraceae bacterium]
METLDIRAPHDNRLIETLPLQDKAAVETALQTAYSLYRDRSRWMPKHQRVAILERLVGLMGEQVEELTNIAAEEGGKPYQDSKVEVHRAINGVKLAIEHLGQMGGQEIPMGHTASSVNRLAFTTREPIGVVVSISAFNHPLNLIVHQTVPAIAVGSPVIVKPALTTPRSCLKLVELINEAGLPKEWCQALLCGNEAAEQLVTDERVNYLSFIGSARVGWYLRSKLAPGTRIALEHGGAAPVIVGEDADLDAILPPLMKGGFYHAGQVCVSVQRVYAPQNQSRSLAEKLAAAAEKLVVGDPLDAATEVGPLILPREVDRVEAWVAEAKAAGAEVLCGGHRINDFYYAPTVLLDPPADAKVSTQEIFGPVVCVYSYTDRMEAIERANSLPYAFQASVFTQHLDTALDTVQRLNATAVMVNDHTAFRVDWMPFGGRDASGIGMGGIPYSMHEM